MADLLERRVWGGILISFAIAQYVITARMVWRSPAPHWWIEQARVGGIDAVLFFPHTLFQLLGPIVLLMIGTTMLRREVSKRVWRFLVAALASLVALALSFHAWNLALFAPMLPFYVLALIWIGVRASPRTRAGAAR